jgi:transposase
MKQVKAQDCVSNRVDGEDEGAGLPVVRRGAAGIDLGSEVHWVCAPKANGLGREVATFGATTPELEKMAAWLKERKVETVALESTGVYWIAPHEVLERHGFELILVNTRELARVPGRKKTDRVDCKWIGHKRDGMVSLSWTRLTVASSPVVKSA